LARKIDERELVLSSFLEREKSGIALACHALARAFARGGTLIPFGTGSAATDAAHVAVEFMHPVIVGKRALPAFAPTNDPTGASTPARLAGPDDVALGIVHGRDDPSVRAFLDESRRRGLLTIALWGPGDPPGADFSFVVPSDDPQLVQEVQETVYHVLWELVHVFFEHPGLLGDACITCGDVAVEARVVSLDNGFAVVEKDGLRVQVAVDLLEEKVAVGDLLLCHAGVALEKLE
jgi:D-sedoheptulose 7-phosphate isomerase